MEIHGEVTLKCLDPKRLNLSLSLDNVSNLQVKPNPNMDRTVWS